MCGTQQRWKEHGASDFGGSGNRDRFRSSSQFDDRGSYGGFYNKRRGPGGGNRFEEGRGHWKDNTHHVAQRSRRLEIDLFGLPDDMEQTHTGINFNNYDNIPVEASGDEVPQCIEKVNSSHNKEEVINK